MEEGAHLGKDMIGIEDALLSPPAPGFRIRIGFPKL